MNTRNNNFNESSSSLQGSSRAERWRRLTPGRPTGVVERWCRWQPNWQPSGNRLSPLPCPPSFRRRSLPRFHGRANAGNNATGRYSKFTTTQAGLYFFVFKNRVLGPLYYSVFPSQGREFTRLQGASFRLYVHLRLLSWVSCVGFSGEFLLVFHKNTLMPQARATSPRIVAFLSKCPFGRPESTAHIFRRPPFLHGSKWSGRSFLRLPCRSHAIELICSKKSVAIYLPIWMREGKDNTRQHTTRPPFWAIGEG